MTLELINTIASVTTTVIIAATAIAALVQLRHLRGANQINGQLALRQVLLDRAFLDAVGRARQEVPKLMQEPAFRKYVADYHLGLAEDNERYDSLYEEILMSAAISRTSATWCATVSPTGASSSSNGRRL